MKNNAQSMATRIALVAGLVMLPLAGCSSFKTTILEQNPDGTLRKGITVAGVYMEEEEEIGFVWTATPTLYRLPDGSHERVLVIKDLANPRPLTKTRRLALDVERPISGTAKNAIEFNENGTLKKVSNDVDDKTLEVASNEFQEILGKLDELAGGRDAFPTGTTVEREETSYLVIYDKRTEMFYRQDFSPDTLPTWPGG